MVEGVRRAIAAIHSPLSSNEERLQAMKVAPEIVYATIDLRQLSFLCGSVLRRV